MLFGGLCAVLAIWLTRHPRQSITQQLQARPPPPNKTAWRPKYTDPDYPYEPPPWSN